MQIYILNRARETLATTSGIYDDKHTLTLDAGSSSYEFKINKSDEASQYMDSGNYIVLQDDDGKTWLFTILDYEETQYTKTVYAEDAGIELLNKACDIWKSNGPHSFEYYFNIVTNGTPWKLGVNQLAGLERTLTYEGRDTGLGRLLSILTAFDHAECTFDVTVKMNAPSNFEINVYKQIGDDRSDVQMVYNHELDDITKKESRAEFVTALCGVGGTVTPPEGQEMAEQKNIDFADLEYNKDGLVTTKGDKFLRAVDANKRFNPGQTTYIEAFYEYDTQSASELLNRTITRLKTYSEPQYTYTADVKIIDSTLKVGDTVTIIDHDYNPALYLSARVAKLEKSYTDPSQNTIEFCNYRLLSSRLADKLARLQTIINKMPSASQVGKLESNVSDLSKKQDELASQITTANGKNTNFYGKTEPATPKNGDLWYKKLENGEIEMYQYQDGVWQLLASTAKMTTVQTELAQAKADITQAKADAQNAYDEAVKATNTANGAKAQTAEALEQAKQANSSYTALSKEVADNKASVDADYKKAQTDIAQARADAQNAYNEAVKATSAANGIKAQTDEALEQAKAQTDEALKQAKQANDSYTTLAKEVAGNKASTDADYQKAQAAIAQAQKDLSGMTGAVAEVKKGQGELSAKVAGKVDNTVYQTYVTQTNQALSEKLVASDLNGYAKTVDVTKSIDGVKTTVADNAGKISTVQTDINGVKSTVKSAQGDISTLQTDAKSIKATVSSNTGKITQLATDVSGVKSSVSSKVDKTTYQSYVAQTDKALSTKLTASDLQGYAKTADVKQTTDGLSASITKVQGNLAYQASELIGKKSFEDGNVGEWICNDYKTKAMISGITGYSAYGYHKCIYTPNNGDLYWGVDCKVKPGDKYYVELLVPNFYSAHGGRTITVMALFAYTKDGKINWQLGPYGQVATSNNGWIKGVITVPDGVTSVKPCISVIDNGANSIVYLTYASFVKLDDYTQSQITTLSGKITATSDRLSSVYTKSETDKKLSTKVEQSTLTQTADGLSASIAKNSKALSSNTSKITQLTADVNGVKTTVADNTGKISTISQTVNGVKTSVANAQGDISALQTDAKSIKATVASNAGKITQLVTDVNGVKTTVGNAQGDIATLQTDAKNIKATVSSNTGKITTVQTDVNGIKTNVKNAQGDISSLQTDAKSIKATVSSNAGKITQLTTDVNGIKSTVSSKVDKATYQSYVTQTDKALSAKLTASDLNGYARTADIKQTTDGLSASITKVQGDLANQAAELIGKKSFKDRDVGDWYCADLKTRATLDGGGPVYGLYNWIRPSVGYDLCYNNAEIPVKAGDVFYVEAFSPNFHDQNNRLSIIVRADLRYSQNGSVKYQQGPSVTIPPDRWGWLKGTVTVPDGVTGVIPYFSTRNDVDFKAAKTYLAYASFVKLDDYTQSQLNTLSGKITATSDRLSSVYTKSETDAKLRTKVEQSVLTQTSNNLSASIAKNSKILSSAGLVNENAYINANKIALNGKVLMTNAVINDAFIGNLSANKITTGTLNAAKVNLINVNASNISTGVLNGVKITSTGKDPSGTSSTTTIQSGYIDTNVINCSDYILVGKADADPRKRWQTKQDSFGMWFQTPAKLNGHTGNAPSDWQSEWQGFIGGDGWNYKRATISGSGQSGIQLALTPQQIWGNPYGGDQWAIGNWVRTETSNQSGDIRDGALDPVMWYSYTGQGAAYADQLVIQKKTQFFGKANLQDGVRIGVTGANHGIRTAWVAWSDWGLNQKVPCIVQDTDNWGGIAFPANGRAVLFTHNYRVNTDALPRDGGVYNGWGG